MKTIIALTGVKTSGKSTAFNFVKEAYPEVREIQLAKRLKDACSDVLGIERDAFDNPAKKEVALETPVYLDQAKVESLIRYFGFEPDYDKHVRAHVGTVLETPRRAAQYVGTEILRAVDPDVHCKGSVLGLPEDGLFVVTDMRFLNEYDFFAKNYKFEFFPFYIQSDRAEFNATDMHPSERQVLEVAKLCKKLPNNGSMEDLKAMVLEEISSVMEPHG